MQQTSGFRGVNLGGWLVLEKWMTPSLFKDTPARNEYELAQSALGKRIIRHHHESFIIEDDFKWLQDNHIRMVRLPVGHWIFGDEPPYVCAIDRLDWAMAMAAKYDLKVLIDLHGAPGAQNAADHSGSGKPGLPVWLNDASKQERTVQTLEKLVERYNPSSAFWGIELVNEPLADRFGFKLIRFYRRAYSRLLKIARPGLTVVFSDGFKPYVLTGAIWQRKRLPVAIDCHLYQCFSDEDKQLTVPKQLTKARQRRWLIQLLRLWQPVIVGEWSGVLPWTQLEHLSETERLGARQEFIAVQQQANSGAIAAFYWNYKTEKNSGWNLRAMAETDPEMLQ